VRELAFDGDHVQIDLRSEMRTVPVGSWHGLYGGTWNALPQEQRLDQQINKVVGAPWWCYLSAKFRSKRLCYVSFSQDPADCFAMSFCVIQLCCL
jgi:hypothetical protein